MMYLCYGKLVTIPVLIPPRFHCSPLDVWRWLACHEPLPLVHQWDERRVTSSLPSLHEHCSPKINIVQVSSACLPHSISWTVTPIRQGWTILSQSFWLNATLPYFAYKLHQKCIWWLGSVQIPLRSTGKEMRGRVLSIPDLKAFTIHILAIEIDARGTAPTILLSTYILPLPNSALFLYSLSKMKSEAENGLWEHCSVPLWGQWH